MINGTEADKELSLKHLEAVKRSFCSFCQMPQNGSIRGPQRAIYVAIWQYFNNFRALQQSVHEYKAPKGIAGHTHARVHTRNIIIVISFKQKHILAVRYY